MVVAISPIQIGHQHCVGDNFAIFPCFCSFIAGTHMKKSVIQLSNGKIQLIIRQQQDILCWITRNCTVSVPPLIDGKTMQEYQDIFAELVEMARLHEIPNWEITIFFDASLHSLLNHKALIQRLQQEFSVHIEQLHTDTLSLWSILGRTHNINLRPGATALLEFEREYIHCVLAENNSIIQNYTIPWNYQQITKQHVGNSSNRFDATHLRMLQESIQQTFQQIQWNSRPINLLCTGRPVTAFANLEIGHISGYNHVHGVQFSRLTLRKWQDFLALSNKQNRNNLLNQDTEWTDCIISICYALSEICQRSFRDSFVISQGEIALGSLIMP